MRVHVAAIVQGDYALLRSPAGSFLTRWTGPTDDIGALVDVDLTVPETLQWGREVAPSAGTPLAAGWGPVLLIGAISGLHDTHAEIVLADGDEGVHVTVEGVPAGSDGLSVEVVAQSVDAMPA